MLCDEQCEVCLSSYRVSSEYVAIHKIYVKQLLSQAFRTIWPSTWLSTMNSLDDLSLLLKHLLIISPKYAKKCSKFQCLHCSWFDESDQNILWSGKIWNSPTVSPTLAVREKYFHQNYLNTSKYKSMPNTNKYWALKYWIKPLLLKRVCSTLF